MGCGFAASPSQRTESSSSQIVPANVSKPSLAQRGSHVHSEPVPEARVWIVLTDNLAHRTSLEPDGVRVLAPRTSGAEGYLKHVLSTEGHHRQGVKI